MAGNSRDLVTVLIQSAPTSIVAAVGFFVFHWLAVRRQRRDEIYKDVSKLVADVKELVDAAEEGWRKSGDDAVKNGVVADIRFKTTQLNLVVDHLERRNSKFRPMKRALFDLKKNIDEYYDPVGATQNLADLTRPAMASCSVHAYASANLLNGEAYKAFSNIYR